MKEEKKLEKVPTEDKKEEKEEEKKKEEDEEEDDFDSNKIPEGCAISMRAE
jgi:hypothetical protein